MRTKVITNHGDGAIHGWWIECPGCGMPHVPRAGDWTFNGDFDRPTFFPSLLVEYDHGEDRHHVRCHSFVRDGQIEFLGDSTHALRGQTVDLPEIEPDRQIENHP